MANWTRAHLRHIKQLFRFGERPAITIYESIGSNFFLAPAPGWLNLGWWDGDGTEAEARDAPRRLVEKIAEALPKDGVILDVGNGLGTQDPVIAAVARPRALIALNLTAFQLRAGRDALAHAKARAVNGDATRIPLRDRSVDGVISVEAAFHFPSRAAFFAECARILRPGGVLTMSDITVERRPRRAKELAAGLTQMRVWGIRRAMLASAGDLALMAEQSGLTEVHIEIVTSRVIDPALRLTGARVRGKPDVPRAWRWGAKIAVKQINLLRQRGFLQYVLLTARAPD